MSASWYSGNDTPVGRPVSRRCPAGHSSRSRTRSCGPVLRWRHGGRAAAYICPLERLAPKRASCTSSAGRQPAEQVLQPGAPPLHRPHWPRGSIWQESPGKQRQHPPLGHDGHAAAYVVHREGVAVGVTGADHQHVRVGGIGAVLGSPLHRAEPGSVRQADHRFAGERPSAARATSRGRTRAGFAATNEVAYLPRRHAGPGGPGSDMGARRKPASRSDGESGVMGLRFHSLPVTTTVQTALTLDAPATSRKGRTLTLTGTLTPESLQAPRSRSRATTPPILKASPWAPYRWPPTAPSRPPTPRPSPARSATSWRTAVTTGTPPPRLRRRSTSPATDPLPEHAVMGQFEGHAAPSNRPLCRPPWLCSRPEHRPPLATCRAASSHA